MIRALGLLTAALLGLFAVPAHADSDWIEQLPDVTVVARAVSDQLRVDTANWNFAARGIALKDDDDLFAVYIVGTLVMLRQIILYKYQEEKLSSQDEARLRTIVAAYLEAELLIGQGVGARRGYLTTAQKCADMDCYRRWFKTGISNVHGASYRGRILPRLFCVDELVTNLDKLAQANAVRAPYLPSLAVTLTIEPPLAGVAPAGCSAYGGDADRNGLCDDWQDHPSPDVPPDNSSMRACLPIGRPNQPVLTLGVHAASNRWVEVRTGVNAKHGDNCGTTIVDVEDCDGNVQKRSTSATPGCATIVDGISIRVKCPSGHVVQFVSREYWKRGVTESQAPDSNLEDGKYETGPYSLPDDAGVLHPTCRWKTSDVNNRRWLTDSRVKSNPYYESGGSYIRSRNCMTTLDAPNAGLDPQRYLSIRIVGKSFAVCECGVVTVVDWTRTYFAADPKAPVYEVKAPRVPDSAEIKEFQDLSHGEGFDAWPPPGKCNKCDP